MNEEKIEAFALFYNGKLLNDNGDFCKKKDTPAIALSKSAFSKDVIKRGGFDVLPIKIIILNNDNGNK